MNVSSVSSQPISQLKMQPAKAPGANDHDADDLPGAVAAAPAAPPPGMGAAVDKIA